MKDALISVIEEKKEIEEKINNTLRKELLKEENLTGSPLRLKEVVNLFGAYYTVWTQKVQNPFGSEYEVVLDLLPEFKYRGYMLYVNFNIFREVDFGLVKPISTAKITGVRVR